MSLVILSIGHILITLEREIEKRSYVEVSVFAPFVMQDAWGIRK